MGGVNIETVHELLSTEARRSALGALTGADGPLSRTELARTVVDGDGRREETETGRTAVERLEISLGHVHLPKLEAYGAVERTGDGRYVATELGRDVVEAARAFEARFEAGRDDEGHPPDGRDAVRANDGERDAR